MTMSGRSDFDWGTAPDSRDAGSSPLPAGRDFYGDFQTPSTIARGDM